MSVPTTGSDDDRGHATVPVVTSDAAATGSRVALRDLARPLLPIRRHPAYRRRELRHVRPARAAVTWSCFAKASEEPIAEFVLDPVHNRTGDVWHVLVHGLGPDVLYGYRVHGPYAPRAGHRYKPEAVVLDRYAPALSGGQRWGLPDIPHSRSEGRPTRRCRLIFDEFDWEDDVPAGDAAGADGAL